jgi:hypothetical protein
VVPLLVSLTVTTPEWLPASRLAVEKTRLIESVSVVAVPEDGEGTSQATLEVTCREGRRRHWRR